MVRRKNVFNDKKPQRNIDDFTGLRLPRGVKFSELQPAIVDGNFVGKVHEKVAFDYPIELGQTIVCIGTIFNIDDDGRTIYIWNETLGNRVYSFKLPQALSWVCDIRLLSDGNTETRTRKKRAYKRRNATTEIETNVEIEGIDDELNDRS